MAQSYFNEFYFGFEFETLVKTKEEAAAVDIAKVGDLDALVKNSWYSCADPKDEPIISNAELIQIKDKAKQRIYRRWLANKMKQTMEITPSLFQYVYAYTSEYKGSACSLNAQIQEIDLQKRWMVEHDSSVKLIEQGETKKLPYCYTDLGLEQTENENENEKVKVNVNNSVSLNNTHTNDFLNVQTKKHFILEHIEIISPKISLNESNEVYTHFEKFIKASKPGKSGKSETSPTNSTDAITFLHNTTTSTHIHYSHTSFDDLANLFNICKSWLIFEPLFFRLVPTWRRNNMYCKPMYDIMHHAFMQEGAFEENEKNEENAHDQLMGFLLSTDNKSFYDIISKIDTNKMKRAIVVFFQGDPSDKENRYAALNILNLLNGGLGTIEVRLKHGSSEMEELYWYTHLFAAFFKQAIHLPTLYANSSSYTDTVLGLYKLKDNTDLSYAHACLNALFNVLYTPKNIDENSDERRWYQTMHAYFQYQLNRVSQDFHDLMSLGNMNTDNTLGGSPKAKAMAIDKMFLFSYGSYSGEQLAKRVKADHTKPKRAYLENYKRTFAGYSKKWKGGVATVVKEKGSRVQGNIYELTPAQLGALDKFEKGYTRVRKYVNLSNNKAKRILCHMYVRNDPTFTHPPSSEYLAAIQEMLKDRQDTR